MRTRFGSTMFAALYLLIFGDRDPYHVGFVVTSTSLASDSDRTICTPDSPWPLQARKPTLVGIFPGRVRNPRTCHRTR
jgi:hypothetical protein